MRKYAELRVHIFILSVALNLFLAVILFTPIAEQLHKPLIESDIPKKSSVIVILASDVYKTGMPGQRTYARLIKGIELYQKGFGEKIVCLGGTMTVSGMIVPFGEAMKRMLVLFGIEKERS